MNGYIIIDWVRGTNSVKVCESYLKSIKDPNINQIAKQQQKQNLISFLLGLRDNAFYHQFVNDVKDEDIIENPYNILKKFPIADKSFIREHFEEIRDSKWKGENGYTGGSTGTPFHYIIDKQILSDTVGYSLFMWHYFVDYNYNDKVLVIGGTSIGDKHNVKKRILHYFQKRTYISGGEITIENAIKLVQLINKAKRPLILYGYPSSICEYISLIKRLKLNIVIKNIKAVITTSETLFPHRRTVIENFFGKKVANLYGARDGGISAGSLDDKTFIYNGMDCFVENVKFDGINELVITNLHSKAFPFVRYRIGDVADLSTSENGYPFLLNNLAGRTRDFVTMPNGNKIHGSTFNKIFSHYPISEYQIIQHADLSCDIRIVVPKNTNIKQITEELKVLLKGIECLVNPVDNILREKNNKLRNIISEVE